MNEHEDSYDEGFAAGYAEGFVEASLSTASQPMFEMESCTCLVMSYGVRSPDPNCPVHKVRHVG